MFLKKIFVILILIVYTKFSFTQNISNYNKKKVIFQDTIFLDSLLIEPNSVIINSNNQTIASEDWFLYKNCFIVFKKTFSDTLTISYRTINIRKKYYTFDTTTIIVVSVKEKKNNTYQNIFKNNELLSNGTFMRGITIGSNQNAVLTNKMNLSIGGQVTENMYIKLQANDYTMPVTPDGSTQRIDELNNVSIELYGSKWKISAGDITSTNNSFFGKYEKQIKGIAGKIFDSTYSNSNYMGIAKGRYKRQIVTPQNGIQGPYQLTGANDETFIFILEKSIRVVLDGNILNEKEDYEINYANSQITFSNKNIITSQSRIEVYFEYSERVYNRFVVTSKNTFRIKNTTFGFNLFSQSDNKNNPIDLSLNDTLKQFLFNIGDSTNNAIWQNYQICNLDPNKILYKLKDSIINNQNVKIFEYSTNINDQLYSVNFSFVGQNLGSYIVAKELTNGRIYKFVGYGNGQYEPFTKIIAPQKKQLVEISTETAVNKYTLSSNISLSNFDINTFSPLDDKNNIGSALNINIKHNSNQKDTLNKIHYEFEIMNISNNYNSIENIFNSDFYRYWNLYDFEQNGITQFSLKTINKKQNSLFSIEVENLFCKNEEYIAVRPKIKLNKKIKKLLLNSNLQTLFSSDKKNKSFFETGSLLITKAIKKSSISLKYSNEINYLIDKKNNVLSNKAFMIHTGEIEWKNNDTANFKKYFSYTLNTNYQPQNKHYNLASLNNIFKTSFFISQNSTKEKIDFSYFIFKNKSQIDTTPNFNQFLCNIFIETQILKKVISISFNNSITAIKEPLFQFVFIEVEPSKGSYMWIDYNNDQQQQTDEFELAHFSDEGRFTKIPLNSNKYTNSYNNKIIGFATISLSNLIFKKNKLKNLLERINNSTSLIFENKSPKIFNFISNSAQLSKTLSFSNNLKFLISKKIQINYVFQKNNFVQTTYLGTDKNALNNNNIEIKFYPNNLSQISNQVFFKKNIQNNNYSTNRNFELKTIENSFNGKIIKDEIETEIILKISQIKNLQGIEKLNNYEITTNTTIKPNEKIENGLTLSYIYNNYQGNINTPIAYTMLLGLKNGSNYIGSIQFVYNLNKIFKINIQYNLRYSNTTTPIHSLSFNIIGVL